MKKNLFYLFIVQGVNYLFPLITLPYLVRTLGEVPYGHLILGQALIQYFIIITDYGFNLSSTKKITQATNHDELSKIFTITINAKIVLLISCFLSLIVVVTFVPMYQHIKTVCFILFLAVVGSVSFPLYLFQGMELMRGITWISILAKMISFLMLILTVKGPGDIRYAALAFSLAYLSMGLISLYIIRKRKLVKYTGFSLRHSLIELKSGSHIFISQIAISFYTTFNVILVGHFYDARLVAIYSAADRLRGAVQALFIPVQQVIFPRINKDSKPIGEKLKKYGGMFILFSLAISLVVFFAGEKIAILYFGGNFSYSGTLFKWSSVLIFIVSISIVVAQWGLITIGKEKSLLKIYCLGAVFHCMYTPLITIQYGLIGMLVSVIITEFILVSIMSHTLLKYIRR
ncbi:oligosaccharide flippase family protein [Pantoea sp. Acro-807]|uniref:oligosaccharide flippase family protein n=1 Tax=Pantoea sp. Acro-807 TaxID=2608356 RepID=UPI00141934BA|nr:oligosaccharide flippase family protein [Pantoea sp. Acro-807]NIE70575.1 oligosaccharide flippase family protein [Pantoea sp. Acro-807]